MAHRLFGSLISRRGFAIAGFVALSAFGSAHETAFAAAEVATKSEAQPHPQSAIGESLKSPEKKSWLTKVGDRLASLDIKLKLKLLDLELIDGLKAALNYKYEVEPSYGGEYHLRMDRATLTANVNVGELISRSNQYVGINLKHETELLYVRPYEKKGDALKAIPFGYEAVPTSVEDILSRLPFNSENVINSLKVGDFFSFTAEMSVVVGANSLPLSVSTPAFVYTHLMISGQFQVHLYKAEDQKVRVKLIALRKNEKGAGLIAGIGKDHRILGLRVVDRRIEKVMNLTEMIKIGFTDTDSKLFLVDYMLDLRDPRVRDAYDGIIAKVVEVKTVQIADPRKSSEELTNQLISDITPLETIYAAEMSKPTASRVVDRFFKGKNEVEISPKTSFKFAPVVFKLSRESEYVENMLTSSAPNEALSYYRLHTFQRTSEASFWFSYYKAVSVSRASLLFDSNAKHDIGDIRDIVFEWNYRDKSLTAAELRMLKAAVKQAVPESIHKGLNWGVFARETEYANARFIYKTVLHPSALGVVKSMSSGEIFGLLADYIKSIPAPSAAVGKDMDGRAIKIDKFNSVVDQHQDSLLNIAHYLAKVVDPKLTNSERSNAFAELRFNDLFIEIGPGFLISLLPQNELQKYVNFEISLTADDVAPMKYTFGTIADRKIYEAASYIQAVLTANEFETITQMMNSTKTK